MDMTQIPLFALADRRLAWLDQRQQVLAQNIANADTPGYTARDLVPFARLLEGAGAAPALAVTEPGHIPGRENGTAAGQSPRPAARAPDGNAVSLQQELVKMADNDANHALVANLYRKYLGLFRTAIGKG